MRKRVSIPVLGVWFRIVIYMGVHKFPAVRDHWQHDGLNPAHPISGHRPDSIGGDKEILSCVSRWPATPLCNCLDGFKIGACRTARPNSVGFLVELKIPKQAVNKHEHCSLKSMMPKDPHFNHRDAAD